MTGVIVPRFPKSDTHVCITVKYTIVSFYVPKLYFDENYFSGKYWYLRCKCKAK